MAKDLVVKRIYGCEISEVPQLKKRKRWTKNDVTLVLMASLGVIFLAVFAYAPLYGLVLALKNCKDED